jgi:hypothetical protein
LSNVSNRAAMPRLRWLEDEPDGEWPQTQRLDRFGRLGLMPVADREILNLSHHAPLAVALGVGAPHVVALIDPDLLSAPCIDAHGRWLPSYQPLALRCLPFYLADPAGERPRRALLEGLSDPADAQTLRYREAGGGLTPAYRRAIDGLDQLAIGARRLRQAAETLLAADLLEPLRFEGAAGQHFASAALMAADPARLIALSPLRTRLLAREGMLALDLMTASYFSLRLLRPGTRRRDLPVPALRPDSGLALDPGLEPLDLGGAEVVLDDSALFSVDAFLAASRERE